jgi:hypothetical protein
MDQAPDNSRIGSFQGNKKSRCRIKFLPDMRIVDCGDTKENSDSIIVRRLEWGV